MPDPVAALGGASFDGFARVREVGPTGMITLRCEPDDAAGALEAQSFPMPDRRRLTRRGTRAAGWMSPDELLLVLPYAEVAATLTSIGATMGARHHLAVDVSDARAVFRIEGGRAHEVLMKLCPVDFATLAEGELRRTRAAQVACAFWAEDGGYTLVSFRSVAGYVMGLLTHAAMPGSELFPA